MRASVLFILFIAGMCFSQTFKMVVELKGKDPQTFYTDDISKVRFEEVQGIVVTYKVTIFDKNMNRAPRDKVEVFYTKSYTSTEVRACNTLFTTTNTTRSALTNSEGEVVFVFEIPPCYKEDYLAGNYNYLYYLKAKYNGVEYPLDPLLSSYIIPESKTFNAKLVNVVFP
jgi:hypothetical protein